MKDYIDQAAKNGIRLLKEGRCQFCGGHYTNGIAECMNHYNHLSETLDFNNPAHHHSRFLSVDAHALQHPEIHGRWSNHFHLTRLHLILAHQVKWNYQKSPLLSEALNRYKQEKPDEMLEIPEPCKRGDITSKEISASASPDETIARINEWATSVYHSWIPKNTIINQLANEFLIR